MSMSQIEMTLLYTYMCVCVSENKFQNTQLPQHSQFKEVNERGKYLCALRHKHFMSLKLTYSRTFDIVQDSSVYCACTTYPERRIKPYILCHKRLSGKVLRICLDPC